MRAPFWKGAEGESDKQVGDDISLIGRSLKIRGLLETAGETHILGYVAGRINASRIVVGVGGHVEGDMVAQEVVLCGRLTGRVFALNVIIVPGAIVKGRVFHHTINAAKEAQIEGRMPWRPVNFFENLTELPKEL